MAKKLSNFQIEPEELLLDRHESRSIFLDDDSKVENHLNPKNFWALFLFSFIILAVLLGRAFWLNVVKGDYYTKKAQSNNVRFWPQQALRGIIYDRNNKALVENVPVFNLLTITKFLPKNGVELDAMFDSVAVIIDISADTLKKGLAGLDDNMLDPVILQSNIGEEKVLAFEARSEEFPGLVIEKSAIRNYKNGPAFFHMLGYLGRVAKSDIMDDNYYFLTDSIGSFGLESKYEKELRGKKGERATLLNSNGAVLNQVIAEESVPGNNLILSIDGGLQEVLYNSLKNTKIAWKGSGAAAVALDPRNGEVLALVSLPSPDGNDFSRGLTVSKYKIITSDPERPLFNRAISGLYPAGSTVKPLIASAALQEKIIDPIKQIDDTLGYISIPNQYDPDIVYIFKDWKAHGYVDMRSAIAVSANVYFYTIGGGYKNIKGLGIEKIDKYLSLFGLGSVLGIDLNGEKPGLVPTPDWKKKVRKEDWFTGDTYNVSIGQGDLMVTPLQMASAIAAIANNGTLWQPRIVRSISSPEDDILSEFKSNSIRENFIDPENLKIVREGMRQAVHEGSAHLLSALPFETAGKTGTAQFGSANSKSNAWFVGFAPYENPRLTLAIVVDGAGEGSSAAVPIAKDVFEWYFNQPENMLR
ncbi:penicillin-binding protein 2 [Candidatus Azambacteria bacterium RIFCSPHIGHO2_01_FULL_44_55]|uniref:Penicillin-binding protein 2 n=1 Tax=Candidatus Azambacteria bacterium RIFCSPLOWO2_02_FULL_44_14 TaxID=1797306 RepID=A0A1F5CBU4_9BACT|nr:MAG: penicillin-binding protein 2 [Candidatus Azambacteria bacterium RIFCSPLOWO2_01_FULL_44_84]OGD33208.1 MAG: penicillin-binding protein 2 [Candidatus Azambacteria bacterium RIFCSPHIGHO2_02_FULL_45_18]OGD40313.1 MAG: penicillin-binding protein 2 [Candidatus Azambacteria bacterium RIFCSPLOWO2_02_FULL_44_14]OGD40737.1 MAG: penicillin-binding protein 2 [Candidatus Azambacteria bacterium RIFCSPHIGHO2_01_FULL_44_55]